jgi:aryl sulfotransferase
MANFDVMALLAARKQAVGLDDLPDDFKEMLAHRPPLRAESEVERFWVWVDDTTPATDAMSLLATMHHLQTFWEARYQPNIVRLHYADIQRDLEGEMRRLATRLDIDVPEARWPELLEAATFENMRDRADSLAPDTTHKIWTDNRRFFNRGSTGQWRDILSDADLRRYDRSLSELAEPELVAWVQHETTAQRP